MATNCAWSGAHHFLTGLGIAKKEPPEFWVLNKEGY